MLAGAAVSSDDLTGKDCAQAHLMAGLSERGLTPQTDSGLRPVRNQAT